MILRDPSRISCLVVSTRPVGMKTDNVESNVETDRPVNAVTRYANKSDSLSGSLKGVKDTFGLLLKEQNISGAHQMR